MTCSEKITWFVASVLLAAAVAYYAATYEPLDLRFDEPFDMFVRFAEYAVLMATGFFVLCSVSLLRRPEN